jgi:tRNA (guanine10-N2)-dimethyltransferase
LRKDGFSVRVVPNKKTGLNSAQVIHNKLTSGRNIEIVLIKADSGYWIGKTCGVQNIEALARRDQGRPKRDAKVGMLPPKLALMILNLAGAQYRSDSPRTVLDPFCGTGVVLQEALLLGLNSYGTDIDERMVEYTTTNLNWAKQELNLSGLVRVEKGDATKYSWEEPLSLVACETYLGPPMTSAPASNELKKIVSDVNFLHKSFLKNIHDQLAEGARLCLAVPAWRINDEIRHLPMVDDLENMGYTRQVLKHTSNEELIYRRPKQIVARELLILERT